MIDKQQITDAANAAIEGTELFLVDVSVSADNRVVVEIDSADGVGIDQCVSLSHAIRETVDPEKEDYELEVGSVGLTTPFKVIEQYVKNIGNNVNVLTRDGRKLYGRLVEINTIDRRFTIETSVKVKEPGQKRPVEKQIPEEFAIDDCKSVTYAIDFK